MEQPQWGRQGRRARREQARALAKAILQEGTPSRRFGTELMLSVVFFFVGLGWNEVIGGQASWRVVVGWLLWAAAYLPAAHIYLQWAIARKIRKGVRIASVVLATIIFMCLAGWEIWQAVQPSYIYLIPTAELWDNDRRAFFIQQVGPARLENVEIDLWDNKSSTGHSEKYSEIPPGPQDPTAPRYFWWSPSEPWHEDYSVTITARDMRIVQKIMMSTPDRKTLQFAVQVVVNGHGTPVLNCRDSLLSPIENWPNQVSAEPCGHLMSINPPELKGRLEPRPENYVMPDRSFVGGGLKTRPVPTEPEAGLVNRRLTDWQRDNLRDALVAFPKQKVLILVSGGEEETRYALDFREVLRDKLHWSVAGPQNVKHQNVDIQVSASYHFFNNPKPAYQAFQNALKAIGVKCRSGMVMDEDIKSQDLLVLWVAPRTPNGISPDDYAGVRFGDRQKPEGLFGGAPQTKKPISLQ